MKNNVKLTKRIMAMTLTLCMMFSSMAGYVPGWFAAFAEEEAAEATETPVEATAEKQEEAPAKEETPKQEEKPAEKQEEAPAKEETPKQEDKPAEKQEEASAKEETPKQEDKPAVEEPAVEEEPQQEEAPAVEEPAVEEEPQQEEAPAVEEPAAEEEPQQEEAPAVEEPAVEEEAEQEETPAVGEPAVEEEAQQEEAPVVEEPAPVEEAQPGEESVPVESSIPLVVNPEPVTGPAIPVVTYPEENIIEETASEEEPVGLIVLFQENEETDSNGTDVETEITEPETVGPRTLNTRVGQYTIIATGNIPENAVMRVVEIPADAAEKMAGKKTLFAYDVQLIVDGKIWQPEEHGEEVQISIQDENGALNSDHIGVLHVKTNLVNEDGSLSQEALAETIDALREDNIASEVFSTSAKEGVVSFTTKSLSPLVGSEKAMLQAMIDDALIAVSGTLTGRLQVVLKKDMTYEGDIKIQVGDRSVADDFELELSAEDAGEDGMSGGGTTIVNGNITIYGIKVLMNSIMMAANKVVTVQNRSDSTKEANRNLGGELVFTGSKNAPNEASFVIGNKSSATISATDDDDVFTIETKQGAKSVTVSTGDGVDTVNATLNGGKVDISTGFGEDRVNVNIAGTIDELRVDTGDSMDEINVTDNGSAKNGMSVNAGAGDDIISIDVRDSAGSMIVDTGDGGDEVNVTKGDHYNLYSVDYDQYIAAAESPNAATTAVLTIAGADRSDRVTIDASTALAIKGVDVTGEGASVHLKGELAAIENPITWIDANDHSKGFRLHTQLASEATKNDYTLDVSLGNNNFTDSLINKRRVELYASGERFIYDSADQDFTDYVFKTPVSGLRTIIFSRPNSVTADGLLLSNVVLDADETKDANDTISVYDLYASHMNVLVRGKTINFDGTVGARNVRAESIQGTQRMGKAFADYFTGGFDVGDLVSNLVNIQDAATINVNKGANIVAHEDIALVARVKHTGGMLTALPAWVNLLNIKLADAKINVNSGAKLNAVNGNATLEARIQTSTGYEYDDAKKQESAVKEGMPLAVNVIVNETAVNVAKGASVTAGADVVMDARSEIKAATYATSTTIPSPADIAVTVIDNEAKVDVYGTVTAGRRVVANAIGTVKDENVATGASDQYGYGLAGGYIAVNVVNQDVNAIIHDGAVVTAGGDVRVSTRATANVTTSAISSAAQIAEEQMSVGGGFASISKALGQMAWEEIKSWFENDQKKQERIEKLLKSISKSDYSVKLIKTSSENDEKGSATVTTKTRSNGEVSVIVDIQPRSGCRVKNVRYRYLEPGKSEYTYREAVINLDDEGHQTDSRSFIMPDADVEVIVIYDGAPDGKDGDAPQQQNQRKDEDDDDFINIFGLFDDTQDLAGNNAEEDDELFELDGDQYEVHTNYQLAFGDMEHGAVLTWLTGEDDKSLKEIYASEKLLLVVNPAQETLPTGEVVKYKLKEGGLSVTYTIEKDGKTVVKKDVVTPDEQGRYVYTIPEGLPQNTTLTVFADFEPADDDAATTSENHEQVVGALAVGVLTNDGHALIETGSQVTAGGIVDMFGFELNRNITTADGTPVQAGSAKKNTEAKPTPIVKTGFGTGGAEFAVRVNSNVEGAVTGTVDKKEESGASAYHPVFTLSEANASSVDRILISYYSKMDTDVIAGYGTRRTVTILRNADGTYTQEGGGLFDAFKVEKVDGQEVITANLTGLAIQNGTTADISFIFSEEASSSAQNGSQEYLIPNPIQVSYNALKNKDKSEISMGTVAYDGNHSTIGKYYFRVQPNSDAGYTIDAYDANDQTGNNSNKAALYASWTDASGKVQKAALKRDNTCAENVWFFQPTGGSYAIPDGAVITVNAVFREDLRKVKTSDSFDAKEAHGTVSASKSEAKRGDEVELTLVADDGYAADKVQVSWFEPGSASWKTAEKSVDPATGKVRFTMPETSDADTSYIRITPVFTEKTITIKKSDEIAVSEKDGKAWPGAQITVSPSEDKLKEGYKVTEVTLIYNGQQHVFAEGDKVTVPSELSSGDVEITAKLARKTVRVADSLRENGALAPVSGYADAGDKVYVKVEPEDGYRLKSGTLKAEIYTGAASTQLVLKKDKGGWYFTMPSDVDKNTVVTLVGEFEPGSEGLDDSVGAAVAIGVLDADNEVEIKGGNVSAAGGYNMIALSVGGKSTTEAKAGYSKADMGVAGALAVQVGSVDTSLAIRKDENGSITLDKGAFFMLAKGKHEYKTVGDAKGKKDAAEAGDTGVGAGIAVAVDSLSVTGVIEDGVKLVQFTAADNEKKTPTITGITMNIGQKHKDEVTAKAGAAGGSAYVPVAAVDVYNADVLAKLGQLDLSQLQEAISNNPNRTKDDELIWQGILPVAGKVKLKASDASAKAEYNHLVTADASARGGATAIGGAFIVTWIADQARALLNQSISATKAVSVTSSSDNSLKAVATAAVSGGVEGKKDEKSGKGGADKQADSLLGGAGGIAGKYGKLDGAKIQNDAKGRQQAETAESTLTGAGAFVLNMQKNKSLAEIMDNVDLITKDKLEVKSLNRTDATIKADSSATKSDTGVGIGIAINIVRMENIASIGNGYIEARELELAAEIAKAPAKMGTRTVQLDTTSLRTAMQQEIAEAITELIPEKYTNIAGFDLTKVVSKFAGTFSAKLFEDMGLDKLIELAGGDSVGEGFVNASEVIVDRLKQFPMSLVAPLATVFSETLETGDAMMNAEWWETTLEDVLKTVTAEYAGDGWQALKKDILEQSSSAILGNALDMVAGKFSGKGWDASTLKTSMKEAFAKAMDGFVDQMIETTVNKLGDRVPLLNQANVERVKELKKALKEKTMDQIRGDLWTDVTKTFREQVYDYEKYLIKYADGDFVTNAKNELMACLKESTVVMTNEFLDQLTGSLDVRFEKEPKTDRHVITTQAISGAGAKMNSGAGSLAISVANLTTTAEIADSGKGVNITGDGMLSVKAEELRRIRTHATAAVDARGEADNDLGAGNAEDSETGGGAAARKTATYHDKVTVTTGVGGSARFETGDTEDDVRVMLDVEEGYTLKEGDEITISFKNKGSEDEDQTTAVILKSGDSFYIEPLKEIMDADTSYQNADIENLLVSIDVDFDEVLHKVVKPGIKDAAGAKDLDASALSVSVEGREENDGGTTARVGEVVKLTVDRSKNAGSKVKGVEVTYRDAEDIQHTETLDTAIVKLSANKDEIVYGFAMPNCDIGSITVIYEDGEDDQASDTESEDASGRSIGVGAAVAIAYGSSDVKAWIGKRDAGVTAGTVAVRSSVEHEQENYATAGTDPFEGTNTDEDSEKDTGVDAAVSVFIVDNDVIAGIAKGTSVTTTAKSDADLNASFDVSAAIDSDAEDTEVVEVTPGAVVVQASESGATETKASAFATGSNTAVGASVAVNVAISDIKAEVGGKVTASGAVTVKADSASEDETWSIATAMGADVQRNLNKFADKVEATEETANDLTTGKIFDKKAGDNKGKEKSNDTSKRITDRLNDDRVKSEDGDDASENLSVSTNVLRSQGSKLEAGEDGNKASGDAGDLLNKQSGRDDINPLQDGNETKKLQVAATVGITVALHTAAVTVSGDIIADGDVALDAVNAGNFRTRSTAAAMTTEKAKGKTIAAAVGVSVNNNKATVEMSGNITASGDVELFSDLTQNMDEPYIGLLAVQAIGGSVSGKGSEASIAGAAGIVVSHAVTTAKFTGKTLSGGEVSITADDKSKLAVRAGGINVSKGANVGMGISAATIWSGNTVEATVADGAKITADAFKLNAAKQAVTWDDYKFPLSVQDLFSDSSKLSDEERENVYTGLIDIHRKPGETSYTVDVNLDTYALMKAFDALNGLSAVNYYTEAIAGSVVTGDNGGTNKPGAFNGAGSFSIVRVSNSVKAALGNNVIVARREDSEGDVSIIADDATTARMLGGAVSGGKAQKSAGVTVTFLSDEDEAIAEIGNGTSITGAGDVTIASKGDTQAEAYNAAASVNTADQTSFTVGGGINVLLLKNKAKTDIGSLVNINAGGKLDVTAGADMDLKLVSVGVAGARKAVAAGGTVAYIDDAAESTVNIDLNHTLKAQDDVNISAKTTDHLLSVLASASAALEAGKTSFAGAINLLQSRAKGKVTLGAGGVGNGVISEQGNVNIEGIADSRAVNVTASAAGSKGKAIGLSVNANLFRRESVVDIAGGEGYAVNAAKDTLIQAYGNDTTVMAGLAMAGSTGGNAMGGNLPLVSSKNTVATILGKGNFTAGGEAAISSHLKDRTYVIAGSIALSNTKNAVGGTALMAFKENNVRTDLGTSTVAAHGNSGSLAARVAGSPSFSGLYVGATVDNTTVTGAAGVALAGDKGVTANAVVLSSKNNVTVDASQAKLEALASDDWKVDRVYVTYHPVGSAYKYSLWMSIAKLQQYIERMQAGDFTYVRYQLDGVSYTLTANSDLSLANLRKNPGGSVTVKAANDVYNAVFAGGLNFGMSTGIGASAVVLAANNNVTAKAHDIDAQQDVDVIADNREKNLLLNVNAGGSGKTAVELGVTVADMGNRVNAVVASEVKAREGSFNLKANNTTDLTNVAVALAGAGKTAGSPVFVYTGFTGETNAVLEKGTVAAKNGASITANSEKDIDQYTIGAAFSGKTALSGAVSVVSVKDQTNAQTLAGTDVTANRLDIIAGSDYKLVGASAAVAASGQNAAAVNGMVTVIKAATLAELGGDTTTTGDAVNVNAHSKRDVIDVAATVAASGQNAAGITVMALVAGDKLSQDAADQLTYGSGGKDKGAKAFDASAMVETLEGMGIDTASMKAQKDEKGNVTRTSLVDDLKGDGENMDTHVGTNGSFDASSGYTSDDLYTGGDGENVKANETNDIKNAKNIGGSARTANPLDSVTARISSGANVNAQGVKVEARQETLADLFGASVGASGELGGGLSFAMAQLRSNVVAASLGDVNANGKDVSVNAISQSGEVTIEKDSDEELRMAGTIKALGDKLDPTKRSIRAISIAAGAGGSVGVGIAAGAVRTDNVTSATLGGTITEAGNVTVNSDHKYQNVLAATVGLAGGGQAGIAASIAGVGAYGTVSSKLDGSARISGVNPKVNVTTDSEVNADTVALTAAVGGGVGVAAGLSFVRNELTQNTTVDRGASIVNTGSSNGGSLTVKGKSVTTGGGLLMGLSGGTGAVGIGVGVVNVKPTMNTSVGVDGSGTTTLEKLGSVEVLNDASSKASASVLSVSAGGAAVSANVLLTFNDTAATAKAANIAGSMNSFIIDGQLDASGNSDVLALTGGIGAAGVNINYVDVNSANTAELDATNFKPVIAGRLSVTAGDAKGERITSAQTQAITGTAGLVAVGVNVSIARNRAVNEAVINGVDLNAADVLLGSYGKGVAKAEMGGSAVGLVKVTASVVDALNETTNRARMNLTGRLNGSLQAESKVNGVTDVKLITGGGSLVGIDTNVATAYGRTNAVTDVSIGGAADGRQSIVATANGEDNVTTDIDNLIGLNAVSVATMVGAAHAQDIYSARVKLANGNYDLSKVSVSTNSNINATSNVTPSSAGVNLSLGSLGVNVSSATSTVYAGSELALENAKLAAEGDVGVKTVTASRANGIVRPATFSWGLLIDVGVNKASSDLKGTQAATLRLKNSQVAANAVNVQSTVNVADSKATVSTSGESEKDKNEGNRVKLGLVSGEKNTAKANERLASTAAIIGESTQAILTYYDVYDAGTGTYRGRITQAEYNRLSGVKKTMFRYEKVMETKTSYDNNRIDADTLNILAGVSSPSIMTNAEAYTQGAFQVGLLTLGNLEGKAYAGESFNALFSGVAANVKGAADITARGNVKANASGTMPGALAAVNKGESTTTAGVGTESFRQTVKSLIGEDAKLNAGAITLQALNTGKAVSKVDRGESVALGSVSKSSQITDSWYDTGVVIGDRAVLTAKTGDRTDASGVITITSQSRTNAESQVEGESIGVALNVNVMQGQNYIHDENNVDIGEKARLETLKTEGVTKTGGIRVNVDVASQATARTDMTGKSLLLEGTTVAARNTITRTARINVGDYATIRTPGAIRLHLDNGSADDIATIALAGSSGTIALGKADARTALNGSTEIIVGRGVNIIGGGVVRLQAKGGSEGRSGNPGIFTYASVISTGGGINPDVFARTTLNVDNYIEVNRGANSNNAQDKVTIRSETGTVNLWATNEGTYAKTEAYAFGVTGGGRALAKPMTDLNLHNTVWVDHASLEAPKDRVLLEADNGDQNRAIIEMVSTAKLYAVGGSVSADIEWSGTSYNQIRSSDTKAVNTIGTFIHNVFSPNDKNKGIIFKNNRSIDRSFITTLNLSENRGSVSYSSRCDFCGKGKAVDVAAPIRTGTCDPFEKALSPLVDIQRMLEMLGVTKARYGEEDYAAASKIFVLELPVMLEKDVTLNNEQIEKYRLWTNAVTQQDVYLLPNATRLYTRARGDRIMLQYVAEVIRGDVRGDGEIHEIDIITALTAYAFRNPIIPIGSSGSLDFSTGTLTLPSKADFELYLHEVSGKWLIEKIEEGFIRRLDGDQTEINEAVMNGKELPEGVIVEDLTDGGERDNWKLYWLGDSPETAKEADQVLLGLLVNPETDEVDAFRTSVSAIENGEDPVDVSLYLYRDSKSDREEVEKYNCMFFDTAEGEKSLVKVVTDVLMGRELEMPRSLEIVLRGFDLAGADFPVYSLTDHFFALCDGTDGEVSMFDGFYTNTFDGDTFDSDYIRIEGIVDGDLNVTIKEGQPIWPEWTGEDTATDIAGNEYVRVDGEWYPAEEAPEQEIPENAVAA